MTKRLYYTDPMLRTFEATVVDCRPRDGGTEVRLDETAFYPTSGGQPFDTGTLAGLPVVDVIDREDDGIVHVVQGTPATRARVTGEIDWTRRFDHMQQHTGQHILSAAFDRFCQARTVSFHLGSETATIDVAREVSAAEIARAEEEANRVVWEDRTVSVRFASADEAAALPLRKESARAGELRLVEVADFDLSACGGTHVPRTGMVGIVAVAGWERFKGGSRIMFVCGGRALRAHRDFRDIVAGASRLLSVGGAELAPTIERLQGELKAAVKMSQHLHEELSQHRATVLRTKAEAIHGLNVVLSVEPELDGAAIKRLGGEIVREPGFVAILVGAGQPAPVVVARSANVKVDAGAWLKRAVATLGGRGGGRPEQAQGGIPAAPDAILAHARETLGEGDGS